VIFEAVVKVDTFNGCCDRLRLRSGGGGRDRVLDVCAYVVAVVGVPTADVDDGIWMCFNIYFHFYYKFTVMSNLIQL
jgi:hypothetical protein